MTVLLACRSLAKEHVSLSGSRAPALRSVSFEVERGQFLSVVGPSGSGKSTLLNLIAGVYSPSEGSVQFVDPPNPRIGYVLQADALFPWRTVRRNLAYAHDLRGVPRSESEAKAHRLCEQLGMAPEIFLDKYPRELSGGEQRRVALGMAIAMEPDLLLLDEPGAQLDYEAKWAIQLLVQELAPQRGLTVVCVTHDLEEAVFLGDRVMMMREGAIMDLIDIALPRPRHNDVRTSELFNDYRRRLMDRDAST